MYVANSARTLSATAGLLVMSLVASVATAQAPNGSVQGAASTRGEIEAQLAKPLGSVELVQFEIDASKPPARELLSPVVTLVANPNQPLATSQSMSQKKTENTAAKERFANSAKAEAGDSRQVMVRYVAADLKPKQSRRLPVRAVSSLRTAVTKGADAAIKSMVKPPVRQLVAAPAKLPVQKQAVGNRSVNAAKADLLVISDSSLDLPSPPIGGSEPVVLAIDSPIKNGGGIDVALPDEGIVQPVVQAKVQPKVVTQQKAAKPGFAKSGVAKSSQPIVSAPTKVAPADPVGVHVNALNVSPANPTIPSVPANISVAPSSTFPGGILAPQQVALPSNGYQASPVPFASQPNAELGPMAVSPRLEPTPSSQYQTLPVAEAYVPDVPNAWVPQSALTGSFLENASTLDASYQTPSLFSHSWESASCNEDAWPCSSCGQNICCCCEVRWRVRADALFLHRSRADGFDTPLIRKFGEPGVRATIDCPSDAISMDFQGGPRFSLIRDNLCDGCDFEATYYQISQWTGNDFVNGEVATVGFSSIGMGRADVRYESRFHNAEANFFKDLNNWTQCMIGFRWLQFDEHASVTAMTDLVPDFDQRVNTLNNLFGGQFGVRRRIWDRGGFTQVFATAKAGVFNNHIDRTTVGFGTTPLDRNVTSFVGELDFLANFEVTPCWSVQLGYQVIWVTGVAEALDQFFSPDEIFDDGAPILHGFRFGVTRTF